MSTDLHVRLLRPADRDAWQPLWQAYLDFYATVLDPSITDAAFIGLCDGARGFAGFVAVREDDRPIGFVHLVFHPSTWTAAPYCYLEDLYVTPAARGSGAGRALIEAAYAEADRRECDRVYWFTARENATARRLYDKVGVLAPFVVYRR